ncbi:hypothetical protein [Thermocoleostomius sinensis]|jgi:hypothetical protein|uniref:Uncharacterized protein n=1 Tax=Thermocoleostomius sinensis A174 TaxID=2016057 RepID=A0A9E8Z8S6_9CYAN|nr:hypothetical protein [Thermocoleostomius sinensis]WAL58402.1 hypothetical protein OXH18_14550 [Thermocoleostomius sinensis A174]
MKVHADLSNNHLWISQTASSSISQFIRAVHSWRNPIHHLPTTNAPSSSSPPLSNSQPLTPIPNKILDDRDTAPDVAVKWIADCSPNNSKIHDFQ